MSLGNAFIWKSDPGLTGQGWDLEHQFSVPCSLGRLLGIKFSEFALAEGRVTETGMHKLS